MSEQMIVSALKAAIKDLLYVSESDEPFEVVQIQEGSERFDSRAALELLGRGRESPVTAVPVDVFFKDLTQEKTWHGPAEKADVQRYRELLAIIREHLADPKVFRVGKINVDILIIGRTRNGGWAGVKTRAVET